MKNLENKPFVPEVFLSEKFGELQVIEVENKLYFSGTDVAKALGYSNPRDAIGRHCNSNGVVKHDGVKKHGTRHSKSVEQVVSMTFIDEGNVYRLICRSKLKEAAEFEHWVFDEILPTIRTTGGYVNDPKLFVESYLANSPSSVKKIALDILQSLKEQDKVIGAQMPSVEFARAVGQSKTAISVGDFAKVLQNERLDIGRNRLFAWLRKKGYFMKDGNAPKQVYINQGLFQLKESTYYTGRYAHLSTTPLITPKGQMILAEKIRTDFLRKE